MSFCPVCGEDAVDVFCEKHLREQNPLVADVKSVTLTHCTTCDRIKVSNNWQNLGDFDRFLKKHITFHKGAQILEVHFPIPRMEDKEKEFILPVEIEGTVSKNVEPYVEEYEIPIKVEYEACDRCYLANSSYFEGILQIRNPHDAVISYIEKVVGGNKEVYITKAKDVRGGIDYQITDQKYLQQFVHDLRKRFGGVAKTHSKLHTYDHQRSKPVYRLTALLRLPKFNKGDIIETDKKMIRITRMGSTVQGFDIRNRKVTGMPCPDDDEVYIHEPFDAVVSAVKPKLTVLDPEDYQEHAIHKQVEVQPGETVRVVEDSRGKWFLVDDDKHLGIPETQ